MKKYADDFRPGERGYEYTGDWYELNMTGEGLRQQTLSRAVCLAFLSVLFVLGLTRNNGGSHVFFILLPYIAQFLPLAYGWMAVYGLLSLRGKKPETEAGAFLRLRRMDYERWFRRPWRCGLALTILSGTVLLSDLVYLLRQMEDANLGDELFFLVISGLIFALSLLFAVQSRKLYGKICPGSAQKK